MELEELIEALGCENFASAMAAVTRFNSFLDDAKAQLNTKTTTDTIASLRGTLSLVKRLESTTGKSGSDALAQVEAFKTGAERAKTVEGEMQAFKKTQDDRESATLIDASLKSFRLPPAKRETAENFYKEFGLASLKTFLDALPESGIKPKKETSEGPNQPPQNHGDDKPGDEKLTADELRVAKAMRKSPKQALEAKTLWDETNGEISEAHVNDLNAAQMKAARKSA